MSQRKLRTLTDKMYTGRESRGELFHHLDLNIYDGILYFLLQTISSF